MHGSCDSPPPTGSALPSTRDPFASLHCSLTMDGAVPKHAELSVSGSGATADISTDAWKRYHEVVRATPSLSVG